jgi:predicted metal-dependent phosphoesterase TrpH
VDKKHIIQKTKGPRALILDAEAASNLLAAGWAAADLHVHSLHSHDVIPTRLVDPLALYEKARRRGMTYIAFTDHDSMDAYDQIGWTREGIVPAVEVKILDPVRVGHTVHINVYSLDRGQFREILKITRGARDLEQLVAYLRDVHLPFVFNHPFWHEPGEKPNFPAVLEIADLFPVLEYNMGRIRRINEQALRLACAKGKGIVASTDTHVGNIGRAFTVALGRTFNEFFDRIRTGQSFIVPADLTLSSLKEETAIRLGSLFDKSGWLFPKESLALETGNALLDGIIGRLAQARHEAPGFADRMLRKILEALSRSGIPASLYVRGQQNLAVRIGELLESMETAA